MSLSSLPGLLFAYLGFFDTIIHLFFVGEQNMRGKGKQKRRIRKKEQEEQEEEKEEEEEERRTRRVTTVPILGLTMTA